MDQVNVPVRRVDDQCVTMVVLTQRIPVPIVVDLCLCVDLMPMGWNLSYGMDRFANIGWACYEL
jgi:hypothetical protein